MAAKEPISLVHTETHSKTYRGLLHRAYAYTSLGDSDTWDTGDASISHVAWEATGATDDVGLTLSGTTITFGVANTGNGTLHIWSHK